MGTGMSPWTSLIWTFKQFDSCFLFINCPHLKNFKSMFSLLRCFCFFSNISWIHYYKDVRLNTPRINVNVNISCHALYIPLGFFLITFTHWLPANPIDRFDAVWVDSNRIANISYHPFDLLQYLLKEPCESTVSNTSRLKTRRLDSIRVYWTTLPYWRNGRISKTFYKTN